MNTGKICRNNFRIDICRRILCAALFTSTCAADWIKDVNVLIEERNSFLEKGNRTKVFELDIRICEIHKKNLGDHKRTADTLDILSDDYYFVGDMVKSVEVQREAVEMVKRKYGTNSGSYAYMLSGLSSRLMQLGDFPAAILGQDKALEIQKKFEEKTTGILLIWSTEEPIYHKLLESMTMH